ncbi:diguanylate cyclase [Amorphus sp. 3PC139-8]|uniref:GGDEF domain-containing protein n=1 Tax=Amorphus sp. 3PC139-8 TaxID=2735676 RepID=UPI00345DE59F
MGAPAEPLLLSLLGPVTILVFASAYLWTWFITHRRHHYLLAIAFAMILPVPGALLQIFPGTLGKGATTVLSGVLFMAAPLIAAEGVQRRYGRQFGWAWDVALLTVASAGQIYFWYGDQDFQARAYIVNFFGGIVFVTAAVRIWTATRGRTADRLVFWVLFLYGVHVFPRTILISWNVPKSTLAAYDFPLFWQVASLSTAVFASALGLAFLVAVLTEHMDELRRDRDVDPLTGVLNRRGFEEQAGRLLADWTHKDLTLILCDLDHFKRINDTYGHRIGDEVLKRLGSLLSQISRNSDALGRIGGEEFALLAPDCGMEQAEAFSRLIHETIAIADFELPDGRAAIRASLGVAVRQPDETFAAWFDRADAALYRAKAEGRNRTWFAD